MKFSVRTIVTCLCACLTSLSATVHAQPQSVGASGVKVGKGRLHPFGDVDTHFVMNPNRSPSSASVNDVYMGFGAGLEYLLPSDVTDLKFKGDLAWRQYLGIDDSSTTNLSSFTSTVDGRLHLVKTRPFNVKLGDRFTRSTDPGNQFQSQTLNHNQNEASVDFIIAPGGGALSLETGYAIFFDRYDRDFQTAPGLDSLRHRPRLKLKWKFLPKTAAYVGADAEVTRYPNDNFSFQDAGGNSQTFINTDTNIVNAVAGVIGQVTPRFKAQLQAGYGNTVINDTNAANFQTATAQAMVGYKFSETGNITLDYTRSLRPVSGFSYISSDQLTAKFDGQFIGRLQVSAELAYEHQDYGTPRVVSAAATPVTSRTDHVFRGGLEISVEITRWLQVALGNKTEIRSSDFTTVLGDASYVYNDTNLRIRVKY